MTSGIPSAANVSMRREHEERQGMHMRSEDEGRRRRGVEREAGNTRVSLRELALVLSKVSLLLASRDVHHEDEIGSALQLKRLLLLLCLVWPRKDVLHLPALEEMLQLADEPAHTSA